MKSAAFDHWADKARAVKIEDLIAQRGIKLRGTADRCGPCPKCGGDDRFSINIPKQIFNCRGCEKGGDIIALVEHLDGCDFVAACTTLTGEPPPKPNGKDRGASPKKVTTATFEYYDESGAVAYVIERVEYRNTDGTWVPGKDGDKRKKTFRQRRPDPERPGGWLWNVEGVTKVPYNLPPLIEAVAMERVVYVVEGEAKVDALAELGIVATCNAGGAGKWEVGFNSYLRGASVVLVPDNDEAGFRHIHEVGASLAGIAARTRVLILPDLSPKGDVRDWLAAGGTREQLDALVEAAPEWAPPPPEEASPPNDENKAKATASEDELLEALARMAPGVEFARQRAKAAKDLGVPRGAIDAEIEARRSGECETAPLYGWWVNEPWPEPVDGDSLLRDIITRIRRHVVMTFESALTIALWIMVAWVHDEICVHSPILNVNSAEPMSGKTTTMALISFLAPRCISTVDISEAALYRAIDLWEPISFCIDEFDQVLAGAGKHEGKAALASVINSGHTRGQGVLRCEKTGEGGQRPRLFKTFAAKALGMAGRKLPPATLSRCIFVPLQTRKETEQFVEFDHIDDLELANLRSRLLRWSVDNVEKLRGVRPSLPRGFDNRRGNNWRFLFAVSDLCGEEWGEKARTAAGALEGASDVTTTGVQTLAAIKVAFFPESEEEGAEPPEPHEHMSSVGLVDTLGADPTGPWAEWKNGKPITQAQLARVLKAYFIFPKLIRLKGGGVLRGYQRSQFEDAWERYLSKATTPGK